MGRRSARPARFWRGCRAGPWTPSLTHSFARLASQHGFKTSIERTHKLVAHISALSQRLTETAIENIEPSASGNVSTTAGLRKLIEVANADIDRICTQAAEFASDDHVDVVVRQQLATLIFDNAEMRKQLNAYTEGILMQTMERLDVRGATGKMAGLVQDISL